MLQLVHCLDSCLPSLPLPYSIEHHKKSIYGIWLTGGVLKSRISSVTIQTCAIMQSQLQQGPDISRLSPKLQQQWDHQKNAHLGNIIITRHTKRIVSWRCSDCPDGHPHEWETSVKRRTTHDGCPFCTSRRVCKHNSLVTQAPDIAATWDHEANASCPDKFTAQSHHRAHWLCPSCKHKWCATIQARVRNSTGCPQCYNNRRSLKQVAHPTFAACSHPLLAEWD